MVDKDTEVQTKGLRASNTLQTLKPKEVVAVRESLQAHLRGEETLSTEEVLASIPEPRSIFEDAEKALQESQDSIERATGSDTPFTVRKPDAPQAQSIERFKKREETIFKPEGFAPEEKKIRPGTIISFTGPKPPIVVAPKSLEDRLQRVEEQLDGLLDRIVRFNFKASHKL